VSPDWPSPRSRGTLDALRAYRLNPAAGLPLLDMIAPSLAPTGSGAWSESLGVALVGIFAGLGAAALTAGGGAWLGGTEFLEEVRRNLVPRPARRLGVLLRGARSRVQRVNRHRHSAPLRDPP